MTYKQIVETLSKRIDEINTEIRRRKARVDWIWKFLHVDTENYDRKEWQEAYNPIIGLHMRRLIDLNARLVALEGTVEKVLKHKC